MTTKHLMDELDDILSSGYGGELTDWHKAAIRKLFEKVPTNQKEQVWRIYTTDPNDEATVAELKLMKEVTVGGKLIIG